MGRKITLIDQPIYSETTEVFLVDPGHGTHGFCISDKEEGNTLSTMKTLTMDDVLVQMNWDSVDLVKVDIEGAEKELFEMNVGWIAKCKHLEVETH
jgi:FkbM family methyltransferase